MSYLILAIWVWALSSTVPFAVWFLWQLLKLRRQDRAEDVAVCRELAAIQRVHPLDRSTYHDRTLGL